MALMWMQLEHSRLLTEHDVTAAHIAAPHLATLWQASNGRRWRRLSFSLVFGSLLPLVGYLALQWPPSLAMFALVLDSVMLVVCDVLKLLLARQRVREEREHLDEANTVRMVIESLQRPQRPWFKDRDPDDVGLRFRIGVIPRNHFARDWAFILCMAFPLVMLSTLAVETALLDPDDPVAPIDLVLLLAGTLIRLGICIVDTLRLRSDPTPRPELLSQSIIPLAALLITTPATLLVVWLIETLGIASANDQPVVAIFLSLYFAIGTVFGAIGVANVRRLVRTFDAFTARDREQLRERVRRVNGAGIGD
jgi:hypothetical protein